MNQIESAKKGIITEEMKYIAGIESVEESLLLENIASGKVVILKNKQHDIKPVAVGKGLRTKVNANIGTSPEMMNKANEMKKLEACEKYGADTVMDLSLGALLNEIRKDILKKTMLPLGTVPIYQAGFELSRKKIKIEEMTDENYLSVLESQGREGVDFVTVHCGVTLKNWSMIRKKTRLLDVVSRGGSMLCLWMEKNNKENFLYTAFDRILEIAARYDMTLSLGDGMRPGATADAGDAAQIDELILLGQLAGRANEANVQVMIEGPGHVSLDRIEENIKIEKTLCNEAPFYILGPLVTDIAAGYDHIAGAIGGALAASVGADFLCYVTPAEHLSLPDTDDVREGIIASRIAAHAADMVKYGAKFRKLDNDMSIARKNLDWDEMIRCTLDPEKAKNKRSSGAAGEKFCTMCGEFCSVKAINEL